MIDFSSDTATLPTLAMKKAMMAAELGDEQKREDPTTRKLEEMSAELLGHECALFFPSATMANQIAIKILCDPGEALIGAENSHIFSSEGGGIAVHSGVMPYPIKTQTGIFNAEDLRTKYHFSNSPRHTNTKCVTIENTTNMGGGLAWDLGTLNAVLSTINDLNLKSHLDGSRLFNAAVKFGVKSNQLASRFDTVTLCLSKGLGCPMGAVLAFKEKNYERINRLKHVFGGSLRQSGIIAAAGIYAIHHHIERLLEDHENANYLSQKLMNEIEEIQVEINPLSTNMVFFSWNGKNLTPEHFHTICVNNGIRFYQVDKNRFRAVLHLGINKKDVDVAINQIKKIASQ